MTSTISAPAATDIAGRIVQARAYSRLTQSDVCEALGITRRTLSSWEHARTSPTVEQLLVFAQVTGFPATWFVEGLEPAMRVDEFGWLYARPPDGTYSQPCLFGGDTHGGDMAAHHHVEAA
jgi:transcriptional regulator with XRE-family HTH domain